MKLLRAEFTNFRLLRNLILDFASNNERKLIVIRAANESGKTTILNAIQWCLYGDTALPGGGRSFYRLHPIDWDASESNRVPVTVEVDFETKSIRHSRSHGKIESVRRYRLIRSTYDTIRADTWEAGPSSVQLLEFTDRGSSLVDPPEARIKEELPDELREIFFTDGDRALSFIEADVLASTKQERVRRAIESLLGLDVIKEARERVKKTTAEVNRKVRGSDPQDELTRTVSELAQRDEEATKLEQQIQDASQQFVAFDERLAHVEKRIEDALSKGNRDELVAQKRRVDADLKRCGAEKAEAAKIHAALFREASLVCEMLSTVVESGLAKLDELRDQGKIPNSTIPVLKERLVAAECICGEALGGPAVDARRRREHIKVLIEESERADALQGIITDLYYASAPLQPDSSGSGRLWGAKFERVANRRDQLDTRSEQLGEQLRGVEVRISEIPETNLRDLQDTKRNYREQRDRFNASAARLRGELKSIQRRQMELTRERDRLLRRQDEGRRILDDLTVAQDIQNVLTKAYRRLTNEELDKVSQRMNDIFLEMIGADPSQGAIIQSADISRQFDIGVYGSNGRKLNPDRDLNGASRRALTMAFILALARVSEVEAPNVIDTPLGMMSGYVKISVLTTAIRESSQLVLFLTRSEINGCEEIIDEEAAQVITLSNSAHYPVMLVHDPEIDERTVIRCGCNHRQECKICERRRG